MPSGGPRAPDGKARPPAGPGKYTHRSDMSAPAQRQGVYVPPGQPYGERTQLEAGQSSAAVPNRRTAPAPATTRSRAGAAAGHRDLAAILSRPSDYPDEPVTAGLPVGPGPGPDALPKAPPQVNPFVRDLSTGVALIMSRLANPSSEMMDLYLSLRREELG